jgi:hypothetical protein
VTGIDEEHLPCAESQLAAGILEWLPDEPVGDHVDGHSRRWIYDAELSGETEFVDRLASDASAVSGADLDDPDRLATGDHGCVDLGVRRMELAIEERGARGRRSEIDGRLCAQSGKERLEAAAPAFKLPELIAFVKFDAEGPELPVRYVGLRVERRRIGAHDVPQRTT